MGEGGGGALYAPPSLAFCLLLKIILRHPYLKILDLANLFVADAPIKTKIQKFSFTTSQSLLKNRSNNRPCLGELSILDRYRKTF